MTDRTVLVRLKADVGSFVAGMGVARAAVSGFTKDIDTTNDRVAWLTQSILALGPALVPFGAAGIPILTGIATQLTVSIGAAATLGLAFAGVGDALSAVNDYQLEPTTANLEKLQQAMDELGPSGAEFVMFLNSLGPELEKLQQIAGEGIFPGAKEGMEDLMDLMPRAEGLIGDMATAIGQLMAEAGEGLSGEGFEDFFDFLDRNAKPLLLDMGHIVGNFAKGFADMLVAFEPLTLQFSAGFVNMSERFADFWDDAGQDEGFQGFLRYIQESIPKALDFMGALTDAFVALLQAAAPVGDVALPALTAFLEILTAIAQTPLGPVILGLAALTSAYGRLMALSSVSTSGFGKGFKALFPIAAIKEGTAALGTMTTAQQRAQLSAAALADAEKKRHATFRQGLGSLGRTAGLVAGLAVATTGAAEGVGLQNTATLGLIGTMGGPYGAAIGAAIGLVLDFRSANDDLEESFGRIDESLALGIPGFAQARKEIDATAESVLKLRDNSHGLSEVIPFYRELASRVMENPMAGLDKALSSMWSDEIDAINAKSDELVASEDAIYRVGLALDMVFERDETGAIAFAVEDLAAVADRAGPAMEALGVSWAELGAMPRVQQEAWGTVIKDWIANAETAEGRMRNVGTAMASVQDDMLSTADAAGVLEEALDSLLGPGMNLSAAWDELRAGIRHLNEDLNENSKSLTANSDAGDQNRAVIRDQVNAIKDVLVAQAGHNVGAGKMTRTMREQIKVLRQQAVAAGVNKDEFNAYLKVLGLTPKLIRTLIKTNADDAAAAVARLNAQLAKVISKTITITVNRIGDALPKFASGGYYASAYGNVFPGDVANRHQPELAGAGETRVWREPETGGEAYIPLANDDRRPRAKDILELTAAMLGGSVRWFAGGGVQGGGNTFSPTTRPWDLPDVIQETAHQLKGLNRQLALAEKALEREKKQREAVTAKMTELSSGVTTGLSGDIFANASLGGWAQAQGYGGANAVLQGDIMEGKEWIKLVRQLKGKGLEGDALAELLSRNDINLLRAYASMSEKELRGYSKLYDQRATVMAQAGKISGQAAYAGEERGAVRELREVQREVRRLRHAVEQADKRNTDGQKDNADAVTKGMSNAAGGARRKARRRN